MVQQKHTGTCIICGKDIFGKTSDDWYWNLLVHIFKIHTELKLEAKKALRKKHGTTKGIDIIDVLVKDIS